MLSVYNYHNWLPLQSAMIFSELFGWTMPLKQWFLTGSPAEGILKCVLLLSDAQTITTTSTNAITQTRGPQVYIVRKRVPGKVNNDCFIRITHGSACPCNLPRLTVIQCTHSPRRNTFSIESDIAVQQLLLVWILSAETVTFHSHISFSTKLSPWWFRAHRGLPVPNFQNVKYWSRFNML